MKITKEYSEQLYTKMYIAISKATLDKNTYNGCVKELFGGEKISTDTVADFMWAVSHKSDALPNVLFRIINRGRKGLEISRVNSGFYDDQHNHIYGVALIPYIMQATRIRRKEREGKVSKRVYSLETICTEKFYLQKLSDEQLANLQFMINQESDRRAIIREKQARLQQVLELAEMSKEELKELLNM